MNDSGVPAGDDPVVVPFGKPVQGKDFSEKHLLNQLTIAFGLLAVVTAVLGLAGIVYGITLIATVYPGYKTLSLSAALAWIVLGSVLIINPLLPTEGKAGLLIRTVLAAVAIVEAIDIPFNLLGNHFFIETLAVQAGTVLLGSSSSPNSPVAEGLIAAAAAAMFFMVNGSALVPKHNRTKDAVGVTGIFIMLISLTFVLSYMYGDPFLYGTQFIPIAAVSALAAFFIGAGLVAAAGPSAVPVRYFTGDSTRSRLFRTFIPLTVMIILCENLIFAAISPLFAFSDAFRLSASLVLFIFVTILLVARISEGLGRSLELAEQALKLKNEDLRALNDDLMAIEESLRQNVEQVTRKERELSEINVALKTEIEEHKRTGLALWESEQRFHLALRNAPVSVAIQDLNLVFRWVYNQSTMTQEDIVGKTDNDLFIPEDAARLSKLKRQVIETGKEVHEQIWLTINRKRVYLDLYLEPLRDNTGEITGIGVATVDLTSLKNAELALIDNEKRLREANYLLESVTENTQVIIAAEDTNFRYTYFNKTYAAEIFRLTGKKLEIGMNMIDLFSDLPQEQRYELDEWARVLSGEKVSKLIEFGDPKMGKKIYNVLHVPIWDEKGTITGAGEVAYEVTSQVQIEDSLRETTQYLNSLIDYANAPIIVWDKNFRITRFNHAFEYLTGRSSKDVLGQSFDILLPAEYHDEAMDLIRKTSAGERWDSVEMPVMRKDGKVRTVLWNSGSILGSDGKTIVSVIAQGQDITERKETEKKLRETLSLLNAALESMDEGIYVIDTGRKITTYNQNFIALWDLDKTKLIREGDRAVSDYMQSRVKDPKEFLLRLNEINKHPERESFDMIELLDGRIFERHSKPQRVKEGIIGRVWSFRDVTDRKRAEENLVASVQEKEVLLREIHHRVKNNLQLISGLLDMTRMRTHDVSTNSILTDMMLKIQTMAQIHTRLYESKQFGKISITAQFRDQAAALSNIYNLKGHEISCEINSQDVFLPVDQAIPCALVLNEILSNAYKHAFKGRKHGAIEISAVQENGQIRIIVRDDGIGIPSNFDVSRSTSLGLKLIRTLVHHQLKGSIVINSHHGTEIIVKFPIIISGT